jgi:hypothetical protein
MPGGNFQFFINYVDHGIKKFTSMPLIAKQAASVALVLPTIFTEQGPPSILQTNNSSEFAGWYLMMSSQNLLLKRRRCIGLSLKWLGDLLVTQNQMVVLSG